MIHFISLVDTTISRVYLISLLVETKKRFFRKLSHMWVDGTHTTFADDVIPIDEKGINNRVKMG